MPTETTEEEFPLPTCGDVEFVWDVDEEWEWDDDLQEDVVESSPYGRALWPDPQNGRTVTAYVYTRETGAARRRLFTELLANIRNMRDTYPDMTGRNTWAA